MARLTESYKEGRCGRKRTSDPGRSDAYSKVLPKATKDFPPREPHASTGHADLILSARGAASALAPVLAAAAVAGGSRQHASR